MEGVKRHLFLFPSLLRKMYDWVLSWAERPGAGYALAGLAAAEASFFPIPPDILLIALSLSRPRKAFFWALICTAGSVAGGLAGYALGWHFMAGIGQKILNLYHLTDKYDLVRELYRQHDAWAVAVAGFTPLPYKLFTITAGAFDINIVTFFTASLLSRAARFFLIAGLVYAFGPAILKFLDRYFNLCTIVFTVLLIGGFVVIKWLF